MEVRKPVSRIDGDFPIASNSMPLSEAATARRQETKLTKEPISLSCGCKDHTRIRHVQLPKMTTASEFNSMKFCERLKSTRCQNHKL